METKEQKLSWPEQVIYGISIAAWIIIDAVIDAWHWLQCPAPDQPEVHQVISRIMTMLIGALLGMCILSTIGLVLVANNPDLGLWLLKQEWFQATSHWWQTSWPGQLFDWVLR